MRKTLIWGGQIALLAAVGWFAWRNLRGQWTDFQAVREQVMFSPGWVLLAFLGVFTAYAVLIWAWKTVLQGWHQQLPYATAARVWSLSNLGRYLPGKVWSVAGLAVLAQRSGVSGGAAVGSALAMQALSIGTGVGISAALLAGDFASPGVRPLGLIVAGVIALGSVGVLTAPRLVDLTNRITRGRFSLKVLPLRAALDGIVATAVGWVLYGFVLWLLAKGIVPDHVPALPVAIGTFAAAYIVGFIAIFAPGGVVVREVTLAGLLSPVTGAGAAAVLAVGSRLLLTLTELAAPGLASLLPRYAKGRSVDNA